MIDENLKTAIKNNKLVLFIGAGTSIPLKYPNWKNLVLGILDSLNSEFSETSDLNFINLKRSLEDNSRSSLEILNKIENDFENGDIYRIKAKEYTHKVFDEINTNCSLESDIHKLLWKVSTKIITTNYDQILESNKPADPTINIFGNENAFMTLKAQKDESKFLYKIHGDFKNPETIILFESDYQNIYSDSNANQDALESFFKNKTLLFLGFSLSDPFVNNLFTKIKSLYKNHTVGEHYIISTSHNNDFAKFDVKHIKIDNWEESLEDFLKDLINERNNPSEIISIKENHNIEISNILEEDVHSLFALIKSKTEKLKNDPSNKILASEIHDLRSKIDQLIYGELDCLKTFDKEYKNNHLRMLFDNIYGNERLSQDTINEINRIRTDYENHQWFERCQLVSALTCSLFIFNKADDKKISLIVDFINDNEDKVWERALVYLIMILNHLGNKWLRFDSIKRKVKSLTLNIQIQDACQQIIEYILVFGIGRFNFSNDIFENPYFKDNPFNYFLPFFKENNPLFDNIYENYKGEDIDSFIDFLDKFPLPDSLKYIYCNTELKPELKKLGENKDESIEKDATFQLLSINESYFPFAGYIQEFVSFLKSFPALQQKKLIDTQLKITSTPLKDYLLSEKEKFRVLGLHFAKEKNWGQAIINFEKYLNLVSDDIMILDNLANCYLNNKEREKAKKIAENIHLVFPDHEYNILRLVEIYDSEKNYNQALILLNEYLIQNSAKDPLIYFNKSLMLIKLENFNEALISLQKAEELSYQDEKRLFQVYAFVNKKINYFSDSIKYYDKAISLDENDADLYAERAESYEYLGDYEKAFNDINHALSIELKDDYLLTKAYFLLNMYKLDEAYFILIKIRNKDEEYYNALSNYYRLKEDFDKAFSIIESIIINSNDKRYLGTKAAIYSSLDDDDNFYKYLNEVLATGIDVNKFMLDIKLKYKKREKFIEILKKHNQKLY
ncbi:SIR2 family protein [uncultured Chryseobacterium sp.]|uniref:SIR2 family protein n=1 Tax=uncultured Chryseobacterium sp. TaxID=259322 RepID=UPI0025FFBF91|nr:SIR2 family protein [uncultured Chryseobacterium sp.]